MPSVLILALVPALLVQGWTTFYSAYEDGLDAQRRGEYAAALRAYAFAVERRPEPGIRVKTYGLTFLPEYFPYLRQAECALALGDLERAERSLRESEKWAKEPPAQREALSLRLRQARTAREAGQKAKEAPVPTPAKVETPIAEPIKAVPKPPEPAPKSLPPPSESLKPTVAPSPQALPSKVEAPKVAPTRIQPEPLTPGPRVSEPPSAPPVPSPRPEVPAKAEPGPSQPLWIGLGLGAGLTVAAGIWWALRGRPRSGNLLTMRTNPYKVDLDSHKKIAATLLGSGKAPREAMPRRVGPYVITKVLGRGGCATTYLAAHEEDGTEVAVKVPHPHIILDPEFLARFRREAELGSVLDHPRIVRILDPGPKEGDAWIAMHLVRGTTLDAHIRAQPGPMGLAEIVHIAFDVAEAIAHAHSKGVVHRDLKPSNVMLGENGAQVMDFGIARVLDTSMTATTSYIGTPSYSAPEALLNPRVGPPADRYALGIMLFEMLAGHLPFRGDTSFQVLEQHRSAPLPDLRAVRPDAPPRLARLVERLTSKRPEERPEDGEVLTILKSLQAEHPLGG